MLGRNVGPCWIESELGSGGIGTVYRARGDDGGSVALKVFHPHLTQKPEFFYDSKGKA